MLLDTILDEDVGCLDIDLYLIDKMVKASISPCGPIQLDVQQVFLINEKVYFVIFVWKPPIIYLCLC